MPPTSRSARSPATKPTSSPPPTPGAAPQPAGDPRRSVRAAGAANTTPRQRPPFDGDVVFVGDRRTVTRSTAAADSLASLGGGLAGAFPRAVGLALGIMFAPLRLLAGLSMIGAVKNRPPDTPKPFEIQSFRLLLDSGGVIDCVLRGENRSGEMTLGDRVRVHGHRTLRGGRAISVTKVQNLNTGTVIRPRIPFAIRYALPLAILKFVLGALILLMFLAMCGIIK